MRFDHPVGKKIYNREFIDLPTHTRNNEVNVQVSIAMKVLIIHKISRKNGKKNI